MRLRQWQRKFNPEQFLASSDAKKPSRGQVTSGDWRYLLPGVGASHTAGRKLSNKNKMRITHTPFKNKTRAIGSDVAMTLALIGALRNPNKSRFSKLQKLAKTLTKRFL
jgi:hypothetical protein